MLIEYLMEFAHLLRTQLIERPVAIVFVEILTEQLLFLFFLGALFRGGALVLCCEFESGTQRFLIVLTSGMGRNSLRFLLLLQFLNRLPLLSRFFLAFRLFLLSLFLQLALQCALSHLVKLGGRLVFVGATAASLRRVYGLLEPAVSCC